MDELFLKFQLFAEKKNKEIKKLDKYSYSWEIHFDLDGSGYIECSYGYHDSESFGTEYQLIFNSLEDLEQKLDEELK